MKLSLLIIIISILNTGCKSENNYLVTAADNHEVNLHDLDSVRHYLEGFWVLEKDLLKKDYGLLRLDFNEKGIAYWEEIPFSKEIEKSRTWPMNSCEPIVDLIHVDHSNVKIQLTGLDGSVTYNINKLTKTTLIIETDHYLKHKGYSFMN